MRECEWQWPWLLPPPSGLLRGGCSARLPGAHGARGGRWLARAPPSPPIPSACPNFLILGTCRRSSCALPTVITVPSRLPPTVNAAGAVSADATIAAVALASPLTGLAAREGGVQLPGTANIFVSPCPAPLKEAGTERPVGSIFLGPLSNQKVKGRESNLLVLGSGSLSPSHAEMPFC